MLMFTVEQLEEIKRLAALEVPMTEIADKVGGTPHVVRDIVIAIGGHRYGKRGRRKLDVDNDPRMALVVKRRWEGATYKEIAAELKITKQYVQQLCKRVADKLPAVDGRNGPVTRTDEQRRRTRRKDQSQVKAAYLVLRDKGLTNSQIATEMGVSYAHVYTLIGAGIRSKTSSNYGRYVVNLRVGCLTLVAPTAERAWRYRVWECRCEVCGGTVHIGTQALQQREKFGTVECHRMKHVGD